MIWKVNSTLPPSNFQNIRGNCKSTNFYCIVLIRFLPGFCRSFVICVTCHSSPRFSDWCAERHTRRRLCRRHSNSSEVYWAYHLCLNITQAHCPLRRVRRQKASALVYTLLSLRMLVGTCNHVMDQFKGSIIWLVKFTLLSYEWLILRHFHRMGRLHSPFIWSINFKVPPSDSLLLGFFHMVGQFWGDFIGLLNSHCASFLRVSYSTNFVTQYWCF